MKIRIGTRQSALALAQTELVANALRLAEPDIEIEIVKKTTQGDKKLDVSLAELGGKGAFVSEFESLILDGSIDIAVHSAKDLPAELAEGLQIAAVLPREDSRDVLVWRHGEKRDTQSLGRTLVAGTSSPRRALQISSLIDCEVKLLRGNVPTRLNKLLNREYDVIILAAAGLKRLGLLGDERFDFEFLENDKMVPAGGQGIIAIECSEQNKALNELLAKVNDEKTFTEFTTERYILKRLGCGCHEPTAVFSCVNDDCIQMRLFEKIGEKTVSSSVSGLASERYTLADELIAKNQQAGTVYLVGAGPGNPALVSLRAMELLRSCDVVIYDNLACHQLLSYVPSKAEKVFVGKIPGAHSLPQDKINELLVQKALRASCVVRLKGGDPFVFGRGGEEALSLEKAGIAYELVPGITSAVAVLESAGIPVTHRKEARSFHVITGHTAEDMSPELCTKRFSGYAQLEGTLVFLMGVQHLAEIANGLILGGKCPDTPVAIVEQGTTIRQRRVNATLATVVDVARTSGVKNPAVIAVGTVATLNLQSNRLPLCNKKIAVTGTPAFVKKLSSKLKNLGASVLDSPILAIETVNEGLESLPSLESIGWLIFTSANGVRIFFDYVKENKIDFRKFAGVKFCVIGKGTQEALQEYGFNSDFIPVSEFSVEAMSKEFVTEYSSKSQTGLIVALRAADSSSEIQEEFDKAHLPLKDIGIYKISPNKSEISQLKENLDVLDYITFASSSGVRAFFDSLDSAQLPKNCVLVCIGRKTRQTLESYPVSQKIVEAGTFTADGIVKAILGLEK